MARFASQLQQYQANNRGKVPNNTVATSKAVFISQKAYDDFGVGTILYPTSNTTKTKGTVSKKNSGAGQWSTFLENYMWAANDDFTDPGGTPYGVKDEGRVGTGQENISAKARADAMDYIIHVWHGAICGTNEGMVSSSTSGSTRKLAFVYKLEGAGYYCGEI